MHDEVEKLAEKLGEILITHFYFSQRYPGERFGNHIRLTPKGAEALARVAEEHFEEREAQNIPIGEYKDTVGSAYFASVARSLEKSGAGRAAFYIRKGAELLKSEEESPCPPKKRRKK